MLFSYAFLMHTILLIICFAFLRSYTMLEHVEDCGDLVRICFHLQQLHTHQ